MLNDANVRLCRKALGNIFLLFLTFFGLCSCFVFFVFAFTATGSAIGSDDIIAGNVSKHTVLPPGYCGQPKKGHLIFDACFESGEHLQHCFMLRICQYINTNLYHS